MFKEKDLYSILDTALSQGGEFAEIFLEDKFISSIGLEAEKIEKVTSGLDKGAGIRVISEGNTLYAYTNDTILSGLKKAADTVSKAVAKRKKNVHINLTPLIYNQSIDIKKMPSSVPVEDKVELVFTVDSNCRNIDNKIAQVSVRYTDVVQEVTIVNTQGNNIKDTRVRTLLSVNVVACHNGNIQTGYEAVGGFSGFELFDNNIHENMADKAANRALLMLNAKPAPAGTMPIILASEAGGTMIHEACGHGLEADFIQKEISTYKDKLGKKVASEIVTVIDDATLDNKYGYIAYDDEGVPGQRTVLIENGILKEFLYDKLTSMKENRESTGNGRRESYQCKPIPRMTNTYIASGDSNPKDIISSIEKGLYVAKMGGGQVNPTTGDFVFDVAEGYLINNGEIKEAVKGANLAGNGPRILSMIDMIGNDLGFDVGMCGKDGQGVPVASAQPTLRIPELTIGGIIEE